MGVLLHGRSSGPGVDADWSDINMKTITLDGIEYQLTPELEKRIAESIAETRRLLNKELGYSEKFQKKERIEWLKNHLEKLENL